MSPFSSKIIIDTTIEHPQYSFFASDLAIISYINFTQAGALGA